MSEQNKISEDWSDTCDIIEWFNQSEMLSEL